MADDDNNKPERRYPYSEFAQLPLDAVVAGPLIAAVRAQGYAAQQLQEFLEALKDDKVEFSHKRANAEGKGETKVEVPLLAMVPVPYLRIDSMSINFRYEVAQSKVQESKKGAELSGSAQTGALLSPWVNVELEGRVTTESSARSELNRSGSVEINVQASADEMPEGLKRVLSLLSTSVPTTDE